MLWFPCILLYAYVIIPTILLLCFFKPSIIFKRFSTYKKNKFYILVMELPSGCSLFLCMSVKVYSPLLCFTDISLPYKVKVCDYHAPLKPIGIIFPNAFSHVMSLCHISVNLTIFHTFLYCYIYYSDL